MGNTVGTGQPHPIPPPVYNAISLLLQAGQVPLISPPATQSNVQGYTPVNSGAWSRFSTYAQAQAMLPLCQAAVNAIPNVKPVTLAIVDGSSDYEEPYALNVPVNDANPQPGDICCWHIEGQVTIRDAPAAEYNESVGDLLVRSMHPTTSDFAPNGWGGPNLYVRVIPSPEPGDGGAPTLEAYWNA